MKLKLFFLAIFLQFFASSFFSCVSLKLREEADDQLIRELAYSVFKKKTELETFWDTTRGQIFFPGLKSRGKNVLNWSASHLPGDEYEREYFWIAVSPKVSPHQLVSVVYDYRKITVMIRVPERLDRFVTLNLSIIQDSSLIQKASLPTLTSSDRILVRRAIEEVRSLKFRLRDSGDD